MATQVDVIRPCILDGQLCDGLQVLPLFAEGLQGNRLTLRAECIVSNKTCQLRPSTLARLSMPLSEVPWEDCEVCTKRKGGTLSLQDVMCHQPSLLLTSATIPRRIGWLCDLGQLAKDLLAGRPAQPRLSLTNHRLNVDVSCRGRLLTVSLWPNCQAAGPEPIRGYLVDDTEFTLNGIPEDSWPELYGAVRAVLKISLL